MWYSGALDYLQDHSVQIHCTETKKVEEDRRAEQYIQVLLKDLFQDIFLRSSAKWLSC
jgi:hypothetical protein